MKKTAKKIPLYDKLIMIISLLAAAGVVVQLVVLNKLPMKYLIPAVVVLLLIILGLNLILKSRSMMKVNKYLSRFLLVLLSIVLIIGNVYLFKTNSFLSNLTKKYDEIHISVYVRKDDPAKKLEDVKEKTFYADDLHSEIIQEAIADYNKKLNTTIATVEKDNVKDLALSLLNNETDVIIMNDAMVGVFKEEEDPKLRNFTDETKVLYTYKKKTKVENTASNIQVDKDSFTVLISGIDTYGAITTSARSDVNIILTINPKTHTVLMTNTPRDYWVNLPCNGINQYDKLTHAGIYGPACSAETLSGLYDLNIDYTVRVNFDSLINIVDAIGGVTVTPRSTFNIDGYQYYAGQEMLMNGEQALFFSRDRYNQEGGDRGRGENQMLVINSIIDKLVSPAIITNYLGILDAVDGSVETTLAQSDISKLVKMQLSKGGGWNVISSAVDGEGGSDYTYSGGMAYVMYPNTESVEAVKRAINMVKDNKSVDEIKATLGQ